MLEVADVVRAAGAEVCARLAVLPSQQRRCTPSCNAAPALWAGRFTAARTVAPTTSATIPAATGTVPNATASKPGNGWRNSAACCPVPITCDFYAARELRAWPVPSKARLWLAAQRGRGQHPELCADPKWLGAQPALMGVLHTWTRAMLYHPHAHFLVSAGGFPDGQYWRAPKNPKFLFPVQALSEIFRAKMREGLQEAG